MTHTANALSWWHYHGDENNQPLTQSKPNYCFTTALDRAINTIDLTYAEMRGVMPAIMQGQCPDAMMGALLTALRMKGESIEEITAAAQVMRELAIKVDLSDVPNVVDIVGTGAMAQICLMYLPPLPWSQRLLAAMSPSMVMAAFPANRQFRFAAASRYNLALNTEQITQSIKTHGIGFVCAQSPCGNETCDAHSQNTLKRARCLIFWDLWPTLRASKCHDWGI